MIMRFIVSFLLLVLLLVSGLLFYVDYGAVSLVPILQYQHIAEVEGKSLDTVHPSSFRDQMKFIADNKYTVISLYDLAKIYKKKEKIPKRTLAITFDGGYQDFFEHGLSAASKYHFPITVFLQSGNLGKAGFMNKDTVKKIYESYSKYVSFGSNGQTGRDLTRMSGADAYGEIFSSRSSLIKELEISVDFFSFPGGGVTSFLMDKVKESGYLGACATLPGRRMPNTNSLVMKRVAITTTDDNPILYKLKLWGNYILFEEWRREKKTRDTR